MLLGNLGLFSETYNVVKDHFVKNELLSESMNSDFERVGNLMMSSEYVRSYYCPDLATYFFEFRVSADINSISFAVNCVSRKEVIERESPDFGIMVDIFTDRKRKLRINSFFSMTLSGDLLWKHIPQVNGLIESEGYLLTVGENGSEEPLFPAREDIYSIDEFREALIPLKYRHSLKIIEIDR